jgi:class 3 adenylate cyclase
VAGSGTPTIAVVGEDRVVAVKGRLYVGRECPGVDENRRLLVEDPSVSRNHLEIHVDAEGQAVAFDTSTNGTLLNGMRLERAVPVPLASGDVLSIGETKLEFQAPAPPSGVARKTRTTVLSAGGMRMVMVAGDLVGSTAIAENTSSEAVASAMSDLFKRIGARVTAHRGTISHLAGDAMLAVWDSNRDEHAADHAVAFALEAAELVAETAPGLPIRGPDGSPLRMGWGVAIGDVSMSHLTRGRSTVLGDPVNVAFRLADSAGRDGLPEVLVTSEVAELSRRPLRLGSETPLAVKGRTTVVNVRSVHR